jgi:hypothetical protein
VPNPLALLAKRTARGSACTCSGSKIAESFQRSTPPAAYGVNLLSNRLRFLLCIVGCVQPLSELLSVSVWASASQRFSCGERIVGPRRELLEQGTVGLR